MTCHVGKGIVVCTGEGKSRLRRLPCPWCCLGRARTQCLVIEIHSGYSAPDILCGRCGFKWTPGEYLYFWPQKQEDRDKRIARVRAARRKR